MATVTDMREREQPIPEEATHPLIAMALGAMRLMWFSLRHPGRAAWINHSTGEVWPAD